MAEREQWSLKTMEQLGTLSRERERERKLTLVILTQVGRTKRLE